MTPPHVEDTQHRVLAALRRAAARARATAVQTRTRLVVVRNGVLVSETVAEPVAPAPDEAH